MRYPSLLLLALAGCIKPEVGIDRSFIVGTVVMPATFENEKALGDNGKSSSAQDLGVIDYGYTVFDGKISDFATHTDDTEGSADVDWLALTVPRDTQSVIYAFVGADAAAGLPPLLPGGSADTDTDVDTDVVETDTDTDTTVETDSDTDIVDTDTSTETDTETGETDDTDDPLVAPMITISIYDLGLTEPELLFSQDVDASAPAAIDFAFTAGTTYGIRVQGVYGDGTAPYRLAIGGTNPSEAGIQVGAYASSDVNNLGYPEAGTTPTDFVVQEDWSYSGSYRALYVKSLTVVTENDNADSDSEPQQVTVVDESPRDVWMFAGTWPNLNSGLRSGVWYSSEPAEVSVGGDGEYVAEPLVLDAIATAQVGMAFAESEPNDVDLNAEPLDTTAAEDLGVLSPLGFLDTITGSIEFFSLDADYVHDADGFKFRVPEECQVFFSLGWSPADVDIDIYVLDSEGSVLSRGATYADPEVNEVPSGTLSPDLDYYVVVAGYTGDPAAETPYTLNLEWAAP